MASRTPIKDAFNAVWEPIKMPTGVILAAATGVAIFAVPIYLATRYESKQPMTVSKCRGIKQAIDPSATYMYDMDMCIARKEDGTLYSYTVIDGKIKREEIKL